MIRSRSVASLADDGDDEDGDDVVAGALLQSSPWVPAARPSVVGEAARAGQTKAKRASLSVGAGLKKKREEIERKWREATHPRTGMRYWYNKDTRQTTWELPAELEALAQEEKADMLLWTRKEHPKKHIAFWVHPHNGHQWKRPAAVPLQPGEEWWRIVHPATGVPYFVNLETHETAWEKPEGYIFTPRQFVHPTFEPLITALEASHARSTGDDSENDDAMSSGAVTPRPSTPRSSGISDARE